MAKSGFGLLVLGTGLAAAAVRFELPMTESRLQIAAWAGVAMLLETVLPAAPPNHRAGRVLLLSAAAAIGVVAMKAHLEPQAVRSDAHIARAAVKRVVR